VSCGIKGFFDVQEYRGRRHFIIEIKGHTLQCRTVTSRETKLACVKQAFLFDMYLQSF
jgi:hypothetical protein